MMGNMGSAFTRAEREALLALWPHWPTLAEGRNEPPPPPPRSQARAVSESMTWGVPSFPLAPSAHDEPPAGDAEDDVYTPAAAHPLACRCAACVEGDPFAEAETWQGWE